jgi:hypothetical protein
MVGNNFCEKSTVEGLSFLVSGLYTPFMVPLYTTTRTMTNIIVTGANMVVASFIVEYQKLSVTRNGKALFNLFNATWLLVGFIVNYGIVVFYQFMPEIFRVWTKGVLAFDPLFFNYMLASGILIVYGSNIITYLKSINRLKEVVAVSVARALILFPLIVVFPKRLENIGLSVLVTEFVINGLLLNLLLYFELGRLQCGQIVSKIIWNAIPFLITGLYVLSNEYFPIEPYLKMAITLIVLTASYLLQISKIDNEALIVRLQIIKYKIFRREK